MRRIKDMSLEVYMRLSVVLLLLIRICNSYELLQSLDGVVGKENITYYRLAKPGDLRIELESVVGDADLLVSDETLSPTFEDCKQFSDTCGVEVINIPHTYNRPVGIGVYGHSYFETSSYIIRIYTNPPKEEELTYEQLMKKYYNYETIDAETHGETPPSNAQSYQSSYTDTSEEDESEGSILWHILITILKVIFEVIL